MTLLPARPPSSMTRRILRGLFLTGGSIGAALMFAELVLRTGLIPDPLSRRLAPAGALHAHSSRLLLIGDSFLYRGGPLDSLLNAEFRGAGIQAVNVAVPGAGPIQYEAALDAWGSRTKPDVVMLGINAGNDISDLMYHPQYRATSLRGRLAVWLRPRLWRWHLYHVVNGAWSQTRQSRALREAIAGVPHDLDPALVTLVRQGKVSPFLVVGQSERKRNLLNDNLLLARPASREAFVELTRILERMRQRCARLGATFIIAVFPDVMQVNTRRNDLWRRFGFTVDDRLAEDGVIQRELGRWAGEHSVRLADLLPAFRTRSAEDLYLPLDFHFNDAGNLLAARILEDSIEAAARRQVRQHR